MIDTSRLKEALRQRVPQGEDPQIVSSSGDARPNILHIGGQLVALLYIDAPLPDEWQPVAQRSVHWPAAVEVCTWHRAHIIVSLLSPPPDSLTGARAITAAAGALAASLPGRVLAGLWGVTVLNSPEVWARLSVAAFAPYPNLPTSLWVSQHPYNDEASGGGGCCHPGFGPIRRSGTGIHSTCTAAAGAARSRIWFVHLSHSERAGSEGWQLLWCVGDGTDQRSFC